MKRNRWMAAALAGLLVVATACGSDNDASGATVVTTAPTVVTTAPTDGTTAGSTPAEPSGEPFRVGVVTSMSGNYEFIGAPTVAGVQAAIAVLNGQGGVAGRPVEYSLCDDETKPEVARSCYDKLMAEGVDIFVGFPLAAATEAVAPKIAEDHVPTWVLGGSYGGANLGGQKYMFSGLPVTEDVLDAVFGWAADQGYKDAWILATEDATGQPCMDFADQDEATRHGIKVLGTNALPAGVQTAAPQVAEIDPKADFTFLCVSGGAGVVAAVAYSQAGLAGPAVAIHSQSVNFIAGAMAGKVSDDKIYVASFCTLGVASGEDMSGYACGDSAKQFADTLAKVAPDAAPDSLAAHAYDGTMLLAQAAAKTDGSGDAIVEYMVGVTDQPGAMGVYTFTNDVRRGLGSNQVVLGVFRQGAWEFNDPLNLPAA